MAVLASGFLRLWLAGSGAALWGFGRAVFLLFCGFWFSGGTMFRLVCSFWVSAADTFPLASKYFGRAAAAGATS